MATVQTVVGVFDSLRAAENARTALVKGGIPGECIEVSRSTAEDDAIAGEAPGQSYENQPGQSPDDSAWARYGEILRIGSTVVSVDVPAKREKRYIEELLRRNGARQTAAREDWR
jgi:hypothetical protein